MNTVKTLLAMVILSLLPHTGIAACNRADLTGAWRIYAKLAAVVRCTVIMPSTGKLITNKSSCFVPGLIKPIPLTGSLVISPDCHITGKLNALTEQRSIDGWLSRNKDNLSGMLWKGTQFTTGEIFSGVK